MATVWQRLVWLFAATVFEWTYKPAQQGRKVAYLTVVSFIILAMVMGLLMMGSTQHTKGASGVGFQPAQQSTPHAPREDHLAERDEYDSGRLEAYPTEELL